MSITVVPGSGTGALAGLEGRFTLSIVEGKHLYEFEYMLPKPPVSPNHADMDSARKSEN